MKIRLVKLFEKSWFGDFNIILDIPCAFQLEANNPKEILEPELDKKQKNHFTNYVQIFKLSGKSLIRLCDEHPDFLTFCMKRAVHRRSYLTSILDEAISQIKLSEKKNFANNQGRENSAEDKESEELEEESKKSKRNKFKHSKDELAKPIYKPKSEEEAFEKKADKLRDRGESESDLDIVSERKLMRKASLPLPDSLEKMKSVISEV